MNRKSKKTIIIIVIILIIGFPLYIDLIGLDPFFKNDGIVDPESKFQRYRREEYSSNKPFFQWWYFTIKDLEQNQYFTFHYNPVDSIKNTIRKGTYISFSMVSRNGNLQKYEKFPYSSFNYPSSGNPMNFNITADNSTSEQNNPSFVLKEVENGHYKAYGNMSHISNTWITENCSNSTNIIWDLDIYRIYGWYGQDDTHFIYDHYGIINWNTYSHDAEVEGTIKINNTIFTFNRTSRFRAYCDENWGENFPSGNLPIEYPWGWYYVGRPDSTSSTPGTFPEEFSIIAGIGYHETGFPLYKTQGQFADIRLNSTNRIGIRFNKIWGASSEYSIMETSNDGDAIRFDVERSNWVNYTDDFGTALIPLNQKLILETYSYKVILDFKSNVSDYNRLLFPHQDYVFSDFEGLGVKCNVTVIERTTTFAFWDVFKKFPQFGNEQVIMQFESDDAGIEYGYFLELDYFKS